MDSIQTYERIMDKAGIDPRPMCQILNLLYSYFTLPWDGSEHSTRIHPSHQENQEGKKWSFTGWLSDVAIVLVKILLDAS